MFGTRQLLLSAPDPLSGLPVLTPKETRPLTELAAEMQKGAFRLQIRKPDERKKQPTEEKIGEASKEQDKPVQSGVISTPIYRFHMAMEKLKHFYEEDGLKPKHSMSNLLARRKDPVLKSYLQYADELTNAFFNTASESFNGNPHAHKRAQELYVALPDLTDRLERHLRDHYKPTGALHAPMREEWESDENILRLEKWMQERLDLAAGAAAPASTAKGSAVSRYTSAEHRAGQQGVEQLG